MSVRAGRVLRIPCVDGEQAELAAGELRGQNVDVEGTDGRFLLVPAGWSPIFVWDLAEQLQHRGFGDDDELARWAADATAVPA